MNVVFGGYRFSSQARTPLVGTQLPTISEPSEMDALSRMPPGSSRSIPTRDLERSTFNPLLKGMCGPVYFTGIAGRHPGESCVVTVGRNVWKSQFGTVALPTGTWRWGLS